MIVKKHEVSGVWTIELSGAELGALFWLAEEGAEHHLKDGTIPLLKAMKAEVDKVILNEGWARL